MSVNQLVTINDYTPFETTNPLTGETMTLYNLNPAKAGQSLLFDTRARTGRRPAGTTPASSSRRPSGCRAAGR